MAKVLKADCSSGNQAYVEKSFPDQGTVWFSLEVWAQQAALDAWSSTHDESDLSGDWIDVYSTAGGHLEGVFVWDNGAGPFFEFWGQLNADGPNMLSCNWHLIEMNLISGGHLHVYIDGVQVAETSFNFDVSVQPNKIRVGQVFGYLAEGYVRDVRVGTTRGGTDVFADDFSSGNLGAWDSSVGAVSVVDEPSCGGGGSDGTVTVTKVGAGSGTVTSSPGGINCGGDCSEFYTAGTTVTLSAVAAPGSIFVGWESTAGCSGVGDCVFNVNGNKSVTARFEPFTSANTSCESAFSITGTSGFTLADNTLANGFDFATDPLFNDDCFGFGSGGGGPLWWRYTNPFSRPVVLRAHVEPSPVGTTIQAAIYGIFRGGCGAFMRDLYPTSGQLRTVSGYSRYDDDVPTISGPDVVDAVVSPGETVYIEVDGYSGDTTDPVVLPPSPNRGTFKLRWSVLSVTLLDGIEESVMEAEANCGVAGDSFDEPTSVVGGVDGISSLAQTAHSEDYLEFGGDSWFTSAWERFANPRASVHRWNGTSVVSYLLPISGVWEQMGIQLNTDGATLWAVTTENGGPAGVGWPNPRAGSPGEPPFWMPAYPVIFRYDAGADAFVLEGRMQPRSANVYSRVALGATSYTGKVGSFDSTAHPSMPGRCYVVWNEKGANGIDLTSADFAANAQWVEHMAVGCFGSAAPFAEFDVGLSAIPIATAAANGDVGGGFIDANQGSPIGNPPFYLQRIGRALLTNDQGVCQLYRMEAQIPTLTPSVPYQKGHVLCDQVEDGGTLTLKQTINYVEPPGSGIAAANGFAGLGNTGYANHMSIEPEAHTEKPIDSANAWGFVRQGDAFPGNHPDFTLFAALGIIGALWLDTDPNAAAGVSATRTAGFRAGVWTNAGGGQSAASFAAQASAAVTAFAPDLLVLDVEVRYGTNPSANWTWHDDMIAAFRALQPTQPIAVTMGPLHDDFNYAAYTGTGCEVWPQSYGALLTDHFDPIIVFDRVVANGVSAGVVAPVLAAPSYPADVNELAAAGRSKWSVFTLDDRPSAPALPATTASGVLRTLLLGWALGNTSGPAVAAHGFALAYNLDPVLAAPERWYNDNAQANGNDVFLGIIADLAVDESAVPSGAGGGRRTLHRDPYGETWAFGVSAILTRRKAVYYDRFCTRSWVNADLPFQDVALGAFSVGQRMRPGRQVTWHEAEDFVRSVTIYEKDPDSTHHPWYAAVAKMKILRRWIACDVGSEVVDVIHGTPILALSFRAEPGSAAAGSIYATPPVFLDGISFRAGPSSATPASTGPGPPVHLDLDFRAE